MIINILSYINMLKKILSYEKQWCDTMKIHNPYYDNWNTLISKKVPDYDIQAYKKYKKYNYVYDKLWVCKSQDIKSGTLESIDNSEILNYPIFIKPRWGHKTATSKDCYKINNYNELIKHKKKRDMMWSEFLDDTEEMTDFMIHNGFITHQITYKYSPLQHGSIADEWKYIGPELKPPERVVKWVNDNLNGFTGVCNVQFRGDKIIEVGLRLARGGAYIYCTENEELIKNINTLVENQIWNYNSVNLSFTPFYSFKCYSSIPLVYLYPQYVMDFIMKISGSKNFYEYYFEPSGGAGMVFFQFMHTDFEIGMRTKKFIETIMYLAQSFFYLMVVILLVIFITRREYFALLSIIVTLLFISKFINPLSAHNNLYNSQKQWIFS